MFREQDPKPANCKDCPRFGQKRCSPSVLTKDTVDVLFVGVQPDSFSAANNIPFYGHGGRVVKAAIASLAASTLAYEKLSLRFTYGVQCIGSDDASPSKKVMLHCHSFLMPTLLSVPPKVVIVMGTDALKQLGIKAAFKEVRGRFLPLPGKPEIPVLVTFGEDALLANPGLFTTFKLDLKNAFEKAITKVTVPKATLEQLTANYVFPKTVEEVKQVCEEIIRYVPEGRGDAASWAIAVDTETTTLHPEKEDAKIIAFCIAWDKGKATTILFEHPKAPSEYLACLSEIREAIKTVLQCAKPKVFHNCKFDLKFIEQKLGIKVINVVYDTLLGEHLLDEAKVGNFGLKALTAGWLPEYSGYEDKLQDFLQIQEGVSRIEETEQEIKNLTPILSGGENKDFLVALEAYKIELEQFEQDQIEHSFVMAAFEGSIRGYAFAKQELVVEQERWKNAPKKERGKKPTKFFTKPVKPKEPKAPRKPIDPRSKKEQKLYTDAGFETVPLEDLCLYGAIDADVTRQLCSIQLKRISQEKSNVRGLMKTHGIPASRVLGRMEYRGVKIDSEYIPRLDTGLTDVIDHAEADLRDMVGFKKNDGTPLNLNHPGTVANILFNDGWRHPVNGMMPPFPTPPEGLRGAYTEKGQLSTSEKALKPLVKYLDDEKKNPTPESLFIERLLTWKKASKARDTFLVNIRALSKRDGFVHASFNLTGTSSGRLSSSDPNLQNQPKFLGGWNIKKLFIPSRDDYVIVNCDYKGAEVRVLTAYCGDEKLIAALNAGMDIHSFFASKVFSNPYEDYVTRDMKTSTGKRLNEERDIIKRTVFGILYGAGAYKIAETCGITVDRAQELINTLFDMFPTIREYIRQIEEELDRAGYVETFFSRRRRFPLAKIAKHTSRSRRQARNFKIQSTSSDIVLAQLVEVDEHLPEIGGSMLLTVHDSMVFEMPKANVNQVDAFLQYYAVQRVREKYTWLPVNFSVDIEVGSSYGECQPLTEYLSNNPFIPKEEGIVEEHEYTSELREEVFLENSN